MIRLTTIGLFVTVLFSTMIRMAFPESSQSIGISFAAFFWTLASMIGGEQPYALRRSDGYFVALILVILAFLTMHVTISDYQIGGIDFSRFFISCGILLLLLTGTHFASLKLIRIPSANLTKAASALIALLVILGFAAAAGVPAVGRGNYSKPVIIFSEPSHFALALLPLLLFRTAIAKRSTQILLIGIALAMAAVLQSLTMIAGILIVSSVLLRKRLLLLLLIPVAAAASTLDLSYYAERLQFSSDTDNLSTLVFLQGWENALLNFQETHGLGVGFQQFGVAGSTGEIAQKIFRLLNGATLSLLDGGTTASKLIGEFGVGGILVIIAYVAAAFRSILYVRRMQRLPPSMRDVRRIFFCCLIASYTFELFIRGVGYFSPGGFLAVVSLISVARMGKTKQIEPGTRSEPLPTSDPPHHRAPPAGSLPLKTPISIESSSP